MQALMCPRDYSRGPALIARSGRVSSPGFDNEQLADFLQLLLLLFGDLRELKFQVRDGLRGDRGDRQPGLLSTPDPANADYRVEAQLVDLRLGGLELLPQLAETFDKVFSVNMLQLVSEPGRCK